MQIFGKRKEYVLKNIFLKFWLYLKVIQSNYNKNGVKNTAITNRNKIPDYCKTNTII